LGDKTGVKSKMVPSLGFPTFSWRQLMRIKLFLKFYGIAEREFVLLDAPAKICPMRVTIRCKLQG
jgi:hypothetical protein